MIFFKELELAFRVGIGPGEDADLKAVVSQPIKIRLNGLAFGLGGKDAAAEFIKEVRKEAREGKQA